jgi:CRP-like cAMP-binding protein
MRRRAAGPEAVGGSSPRSAARDNRDSGQPPQAGRSPVLDEAQLEILRKYGNEHGVAVGDLLFADGDVSYDLIVVLAGKVRIIGRYGQPGKRVIATYGPSHFLGEIGLLTDQRVHLSAVASTVGRVLRVPVTQVRVIMAQDLSLSELILRTFLLRHSILTGLGSGLTLVGSRYDPRARQLIEILARNRLASKWLELEGSPEAEALLRELSVSAAPSRCNSSATPARSRCSWKPAGRESSPSGTSEADQSSGPPPRSAKARWRCGWPSNGCRLLAVPLPIRLEPTAAVGTSHRPQRQAGSDGPSRLTWPVHSPRLRSKSPQAKEQ